MVILQAYLILQVHSPPRCIGKEQVSSEFYLAQQSLSGYVNPSIITKFPIKSKEYYSAEVSIEHLCKRERLSLKTSCGGGGNTCAVRTSPCARPKGFWTRCTLAHISVICMRDFVTLLQAKPMPYIVFEWQFLELPSHPANLKNIVLSIHLPFKFKDSLKLVLSTIF